MAQPQTSSILALDVGERRIGVALCSLISRLPQPHSTLDATDNPIEHIKELAKQENVSAMVVGLPRGLDGQETKQTIMVRQFVDQLKSHVSVPIHMQDEALTSKQAKTELMINKVQYNKGAVDALAATYILNDFLLEHTELSGE